MTSYQTYWEALYGTAQAPAWVERIEKLISRHRPRLLAQIAELSENDSILITYGDSVRADGEKPLHTLGAFCRQHLKGVIGGIHILPFYPWTSDDGFSVVDYRQVDPVLGDWQDVSTLQSDFRLMFDAVINHISAQSAWFQGFLRDEPRYRDYFIALTGSPALSQVVRPRTLPLLTTFNTAAGDKQVWTTFSADQVDLNYKNPEVLLEMLDILLMYVTQGATFIRLDAIAYLWKEPGTSCIHLPQTHLVIQFLRAVLDEIAPQVKLITETNVPHSDNISYFGNGTNEAQLVYNFALPPLVLYTFHHQSARKLSDWARALTPPSAETTFFNFLASHDGIGLNPVKGILSGSEIEALVMRALEHGGLISYKHNPDGSESPYELNINYFDALSNPNGSEPLDKQVDRFIAAQAIMLSLVGVPGIYFHSLLGSRGWLAGVQQTGRNRTINREKCNYQKLQNELADPHSLRAKVFTEYRQLLLARRNCAAFHPHGFQTILNFHPAVFALERLSPDGKSRALCLHNVSGEEITFTTNHSSAKNLFTQQLEQISSLSLNPYQVLWVSL